MNTYDTGLLEARLERRGHRSIDARVKSAQASDGGGPETALGTFGLGRRVPRVHILNTCAVTAEASKEAAKLVRHLKARDPFATVVVTGCGAQVDGLVFDDLPGADLVVANSHKGQLERLLDDHFKGTLEARVFRSNIFRKEDLETGGGREAGHTRAFLKIQDGCNSFCTYCVIPFARGKSRSIPAAELVRRVRELHAQGVNEVVLTGVHIGDYKDKEGAGRTRILEDLIEEILDRTEMPRLRLSSLEPVELTTRLLRLYRNERLCPHFHMSVQSANSKVLHLMRRAYSALDVESALRAISEYVPGAFVGMDVIAGFPGESDDDFADTFERLARLPWTRLHVFPYSERPGTKAARYPASVSRERRVLRSRRLRELSSERFERMARCQVGSEKRTLLLKPVDMHGKGAETLTRDYWPVRVHGAARTGELSRAEKEFLSSRVGEEILVKVTGYDDGQASRMDGVLVGRISGWPSERPLSGELR